MENTTNYNLKKHSGIVKDFNRNMDIIDGELKNINDILYAKAPIDNIADLQRQIDEANSNLADVTLSVNMTSVISSGSLTTAKNALFKRLYGVITITPTAEFSGTGLKIGQIQSSSHYPATNTPFVVHNASRTTYCNGLINTNGEIYLQILSNAVNVSNNYYINCIF